MGTLSVRVTPRSSRPGVEQGESGVVVRVAAPPEGGRATDEARRVLAGALGVPPSSVRLKAGARSRTKLFEVAGLRDDEIARRLRER